MIKDSKVHSSSIYVSIKWEIAARLFSHPINLKFFKLAYVFWRDCSSSTAMSASLENFSRAHLWFIDVSWGIRVVFCLFFVFLVETYLYMSFISPDKFRLCLPSAMLQSYWKFIPQKGWIHLNFKTWWLKILLFLW